MKKSMSNLRNFLGTCSWVLISYLLINATFSKAAFGDEKIEHDQNTCYKHATDSIGNRYCVQRVKSRAKRNYTNNGTAIYSATKITKWDDDLSLAEQKHDVDLFGNVEAGSGVREIHNVVDVGTSVNSSIKDLKIGTVEANGSTTRIYNNVEIDGNVKHRGDSLEIGTVNINGGDAENIETSTSVKAIDTSGKRVTIGGAKVKKSRNVRKVKTKVVVKGDVKSGD